MKSSYFESIVRQFSLQKASYLTRQPICYSVLLAKICLFIKPLSAYRNEATTDQFLFYLLGVCRIIIFLPEKFFKHVMIHIMPPLKTFLFYIMHTYFKTIFYIPLILDLPNSNYIYLEHFLICQCPSYIYDKTFYTCFIL